MGPGEEGSQTHMQAKEALRPWQEVSLQPACEMRTHLCGDGAVLFIGPQPVQLEPPAPRAMTNRDESACCTLPPHLFVANSYAYLTHLAGQQAQHGKVRCSNTAKATTALLTTAALLLSFSFISFSPLPPHLFVAPPNTCRLHPLLSRAQLQLRSRFSALDGKFGRGLAGPPRPEGWQGRPGQSHHTGCVAPRRCQAAAACAAAAVAEDHGWPLRAGARHWTPSLPPQWHVAGARQDGGPSGRPSSNRAPSSSTYTCVVHGPTLRNFLRPPPAPLESLSSACLPACLHPFSSLSASPPAMRHIADLFFDEGGADSASQRAVH